MSSGRARTAQEAPTNGSRLQARTTARRAQERGTRSEGAAVSSSAFLFVLWTVHPLRAMGDSWCTEILYCTSSEVHFGEPESSPGRRICSRSWRGWRDLGLPVVDTLEARRVVRVATHVLCELGVTAGGAFSSAWIAGRNLENGAHGHSGRSKATPCVRLLFL